MTFLKDVRQVGAPDPELKTSPIVDEWEADEQAGSRDLELAQGACYFNGVVYPLGEIVQSGSEVLKCTEGGVWVRSGEWPG